MRFVRLTMAFLAFAAIASGQTPAAREAFAKLAIGGRANANPSIAAEGSFIAVAWSAATASSMDVYAALSRDGGRTYSAPVRVNDVPGDARVNSELPPRIVIVPHRGSRTPDLVVVWTAKAAGGTRLITARSVDGGRTFGASAPVPGSDAAGSRGWESVAADATGRVIVLWLDHRETVAAAGMHHRADSAAKADAPAAPRADPTGRAQLSKLYVASLGGSAAKAITGGVCYCCKTSLVASGRDVYGVWRHVYPGSERDIAFTASHDGGRTFASPVRVSHDGWHIDGCPENGPALAVDRHRRVHVAWPAPPDGKSETPLGLFYATSRDAKGFAPRAQIPTHGPAAHVQLTIGTDGVPLVAWDEIVDGARHIALSRARIDAAGRVVRFEALAPPDDSPDRGWPVLASAGAKAFVAWVNGTGVGNSIRVTRLE